MAVTDTEFRAALSHFPSGVTVVTTRDAARKLHGLTVSAFCSVSLQPPLVLICIESATGSHYAFLESNVFGVNILSTEQAWLSEHFATNSDDKLAAAEFSLSENGVPLLEHCLVNIECSLKESYVGGDHTIFVGQVESVRIRDGEPLIYYRSDYHTIGG